MNTITQAIGMRIRTYRQQYGLTQEELAEKSSLHNTYIGQIERGEKNVTINSLEKILTALDISFAEFFSHFDYDQAASKTDPSQIASQCYDLIHQCTPEKQKQLYHILNSIIDFAK